MSVKYPFVSACGRQRDVVRTTVGQLVLSALKHIWATLAALKVEAALLGGIAVAAWNHIRNTRDVDLLVGVEQSDEEQPQHARSGLSSGLGHQVGPFH